MGAPLPWLGLAAAITLLSGLTLAYLARREQSKPLRLWAWAWFAWAAAAVTLMLVDGHAEASPFFLLCGLFWVASSLCFLDGTYELLARRMPRAWYALAGTCIVLACALALTGAAKGPLAMAPLVAFQCVGMFANGVITLRRMRGHAGALLYGSAMLALAVHLLNAPILANSPRFFLWGFVVAVTLEVMTALGMVMLYYDAARSRLFEAQRALEAKRRIEALGLVASGVAHDFNNMLTVMYGNVDLLRHANAAPATTAEALNNLEQTLQQAGRLTGQLLSFGQRKSVQSQVLDLREIVESTLKLLKKAIPGHIELTFRCADGAHLAEGDRVLVEQILLNLVTNARDAIVDKGRISVDIAGTTAELTLRVSDSGAGMTPELMSRVFEPFFTTKELGKGSGLGLSSVQEAVKQLGGRLHVESRPGQGTTFEVLLPRPPASVQA